ncbi:laccase-2-like [Pecten maximus]|uniref:laccase-2-like n=1 Tax=Pecten maximus TaxID=6579 RepID=UPI0014589D1A|nr:laccase-2-like [Pecten maximus]
MKGPVSCVSLLCVLLTFTAAFEQEVVPKCPPEVEVCEFEWTIDYLETMVVYEEGGNGNPVVNRNGSLYKRTGCDDYEELTQEEMDNTIMADGHYKIVYAINGQVPGPSIVVYEGQQVAVKIQNNLLYEGITIHWHGMVQWLTPWMDGVGTVSHCPINPGESFTYRWMADPQGTHWYHSHLGVERTDGLAGALIVLPRPKLEKVDEYTFDKDYIVFLHDWFPFQSIEINRELDWGLTSYSYGLNESQCYTTTSSTDGGGVGFTPFESGLINGKGHTFHNSDTGDIEALPLERFEVKRNSYYRFRLINAGMLFAFRFSIDQHDVQVIAVDGNDVITMAAESIIVNTGERVDIVLYAGAHQQNYWIRGETLEATANGEDVVPGKAVAVLHYSGVNDDLPTTDRVNCTNEDPCRIINCPFGQYPESYNRQCTPISDLKSTTEQMAIYPVPSAEPEEDFDEIFVNFHFSSGAEVPFTASVNGHKFIPFSAPPQIYPAGNDTHASCEDQDCSDNCHCSYKIKLDLGKTIQLVFLNQDDAVFGMAHPVHMHGHHFHVLKTVYPTYDPETGRVEADNQDIQCNTQSCNNPHWRNSSWEQGNVPGLNLDNPPMKDTIIVPRKGYVVARIRSDNPGYWFMHCHIEMHQISGMAVLFQEGEISEMTPTPEGFPTCGDFQFSEEEFARLTANRKISPRHNKTSDGKHRHHHWFRHAHWRKYLHHRRVYVIIICVLLAVNIATLIIIGMLKRKLSQKQESLPHKREEINKALVFDSMEHPNKSFGSSVSKQKLLA